MLTFTTKELGTDVKSERGWVDKFESHGCDVEHRFGERIGVFLYHACRGYDPKPVHNKGPPKSLSVEDSFRNCTTLKQVEVWLWFVDFHFWVPDPKCG